MAASLIGLARRWGINRRILEKFKSRGYLFGVKTIIIAIFKPVFWLKCLAPSLLRTCLPLRWKKSSTSAAIMLVSTGLKQVEIFQYH